MRASARFAVLVLATLGVTATPAHAAWYTFHRLIPSPNGSPYFGAAMAALDDRFLVGDPGDDTGAPFAGAVYLIDARTGDVLQRIVNPDPQPYAQFGLSVALRGTDIVVAAPQQPVDGLEEVGVVYVFDGPTGALRITIANPTPAADDFFGQNVAADDTSILIGARGDGDPPFPRFPSPGAAYLFDGATGTLRHTYQGPSSEVLGFGLAVGFVGRHPIVGAMPDSARSPFEGGAYVFDEVTGALRQALYRRGPGQFGAAFGSRVGGIGGHAVVASVFDNLVHPSAGAIYLFDDASSVMGAFPNPFPDNVEPGGIGQVTLDAIDDRLLAAGFYHRKDLDTPGGDSVYVIDTLNGDVLQTLEGPPPFGTELSASYVVATGGRIVVSSFGQLFVFDPAGNGYLALGEECDDGNTEDGDGCSARSLFEPTRAEGCPATPSTNCHAAAVGSARLMHRELGDDRKDALTWRMRSEFGATDLGNVATTGFRWCVYDGSGAAQPRRDFVVPGGQCGDASCWRARGAGFFYRDPAGTHGITSVTLRPRPGGGVEVRVRGRGGNLQLPPPPFDLPIHIQLMRADDGSCWTSTFSGARMNDEKWFSARSD